MISSDRRLVWSSPVIRSSHSPLIPPPTLFTSTPLLLLALPPVQFLYLPPLHSRLLYAPQLSYPPRPSSTLPSSTSISPPSPPNLISPTDDFPAMLLSHIGLYLLQIYQNWRRSAASPTDLLIRCTDVLIIDCWHKFERNGLDCHSCCCSVIITMMMIMVVISGAHCEVRVQRTIRVLR